MLTKQPTFRNLGHLHNYVQNPEIFPFAILRAHSVGDSALDFILSAMEPLPEKRTTAQGALSHRWIKTYVLENPTPTLSFESRRTSLEMESLSEQLGVWTVFPTSSDPQPQTTKPVTQPVEDMSSEHLSPGYNSQTTIVRLGKQHSEPQPVLDATLPSHNSTTQKPDKKNRVPWWRNLTRRNQGRDKANCEQPLSFTNLTTSTAKSDCKT
jgi:serine/threonine protein kinase